MRAREVRLWDSRKLSSSVSSLSLGTSSGRFLLPCTLPTRPSCSLASAAASGIAADWWPVTAHLLTQQRIMEVK
ncbi:hypothetical protein GOODEAATRI_004784 [Goodea atripinnis]|uniref:Uncharacterized protein n=1 Tax=Goodea atripinnis TaxID=208336 RepID=A0ABV0MPC1_9TELE